RCAFIGHSAPPCRARSPMPRHPRRCPHPRSLCSFDSSSARRARRGQGSSFSCGFATLTLSWPRRERIRTRTNLLVEALGRRFTDATRTRDTTVSTGHDATVALVTALALFLLAPNAGFAGEPSSRPFRLAPASGLSLSSPENPRASSPCSHFTVLLPEE